MLSLCYSNPEKALGQDVNTRTKEIPQHTHISKANYYF